MKSLATTKRILTDYPAEPYPELARIGSIMIFGDRELIRPAAPKMAHLVGETIMTALHDDIAAYDQARLELEAKHHGEWAVFHSGGFVGVYPEFETAASEAVERFGVGPYLIRQIGVEAIQLSSAMVFRPAHAHGPSGL
ncbi:MAG TPA: hypothetical protein VGI79_03925 [Caulobacteraceae bacterium]